MKLRKEITEVQIFYRIWNWKVVQIKELKLSSKNLLNSLTPKTDRLEH
jgi:hypothetical protein